jgi:hypothetical protein
MADKYIARVKTTTALALAGLGDGHSAIATDRLYEHIHRVGSNFHFLTPDKYYNGATYAYNDREFNNVIIDGIATVGDNIRMENTKKLMGANSAESAYRSLIGLDESNILKVGQDTDITAVTFGTTSELARLNSTGLGVNCTPSYLVHAKKDQNADTSVVIENGNDNAAACTTFLAISDSGNSIRLSQYSSSMDMNYAGLTAKGMSLLHSVNRAGLLINNNQNTPTYFATNNAVKMTIAADGYGKISINGSDGVHSDFYHVGSTGLRIDPWISRLGIGCDPSYLVHAKKDQNAVTAMTIENATNGNLAESGLFLKADSTNNLALEQYATSRPMNVGGLTAGGMGLIYNTNVNGLLMCNYSNTPMYFATNNVVRMTIAAAGLVTFTSGINLGDTNLSKYKEGSFTATLRNQDGTSKGTCSVYYTIVGNLVTINLPSITVYEAATFLYLDGIPSEIRNMSVATLCDAVIPIDDNYTQKIGRLTLSNDKWYICKADGNYLAGNGGTALNGAVFSYRAGA